jgi:secreted PhoX family phosphatase
MSRNNLALSTLSLALLAAGSAQAVDFGASAEAHLHARSKTLFGIVAPLTASAPATTGDYRTDTQLAADQVLLADGLTASYLTREVADSGDMLAFFPAANPTHLIACIEVGREQLSGDADTGSYAAGDKFNPSVQRIDLNTGAVETILRGMSGCDGIRTTPWGTILATEEEDDGGAYEILTPLSTTNYTVVDRATGVIADAAGSVDSDEIAKRTALPVIAWEGLELTTEGVVIGGDELRPGSAALDVDGGAMFKFVPASPWDGVTPVADLASSPLVSGNVYAFQASCRDKSSSSFPQYGQGCEIGQGAWVRIDDVANARGDADAKGATGYYRPEDGHFDPVYTGAGFRFCWTNTGSESAVNYGEVLCMIDTNPMGTGEKTNAKNGFNYLADSAESKGYAVATANRFVEGDTDFNSVDNLAFQPVSGNMYVIEDHNNGDIFACLPDGADRDIKTDGCIKVLSVKDSGAEPTGFTFSADGRTAYVVIQHSSDGLMPLVDDFATDDIIKITGFKSVNNK